MIRKQINRFRDWSEDNLRRLCGRITPEKRLVVLLVMFVLFGASSLYIFASAIYEIGKYEGRRIEHIEALPLKSPQNLRDSINQLNFYDNSGKQN